MEEVKIRLVNDTLLRDNFVHATMDEVVSYCKVKTVLAIDTETTGLDYTTDKVILFQIGDTEKQFLIDTRKNGIKELQSLLEDNNIIKIFHNAKFDVNFIKSTFNINCENVYDTMLAEKILTCGTGKSVSLLNTLNRHLNIQMDKTQQSSFVGHKGDFTIPQLVYAAKDITHLVTIKDKQNNLIERYKLENVVNLENQAVLAFADIEYNGLDLDIPKWLKLSEDSLTDANECLAKMDEEILTNEDYNNFVFKYLQGDLFTSIDTIRKVDVKWTSPKQVLDVFKIMIPELHNVNGKDLLKHSFKHTLIQNYIAYKEKMKIYTSYGQKFIDSLKADKRVHTSFNQILDTGRVSSRSPNMQQIPADNRFRNCFIAPDGWSYVSADYSSQELNVIAFGSQDPVWLKALEEGQDLHSTCADLVYGDEWTNKAETNCAYMRNKSKCNCKEHKRLRTNVKTINFGLAYGMGANKLAETLQIDKHKAEQLIEDYFTAFPSIKGFLDKLGNFGKQFGYIKTFPPYNRRRWFSGWYAKMYNSRENMQELSSIERASKNTPIQGASADMTKRALVLMRAHISTFDIPVKLVMTVHDQIDTICRNDYIEHWQDDMKLLMELAAKEIVTNGLLKAEVTVSDCWEK
jgi:DNA polymerase I-like protein with 3'-5' exonuclease and polymerase domains